MSTKTAYAEALEHIRQRCYPCTCEILEDMYDLSARVVVDEDCPMHSPRRFDPIARAMREPDDQEEPVTEEERAKASANIVFIDGVLAFGCDSASDYPTFITLEGVHEFEGTMWRKPTVQETNHVRIVANGETWREGEYLVEVSSERVWLHPPPKPEERAGSGHIVGMGWARDGVTAKCFCCSLSNDVDVTFARSGGEQRFAIEHLHEHIAARHDVTHLDDFRRQLEGVSLCAGDGVLWDGKPAVVTVGESIRQAASDIGPEVLKSLLAADQKALFAPPGTSDCSGYIESILGKAGADVRAGQLVAVGDDGLVRELSDVAKGLSKVLPDVDCEVILQQLIADYRAASAQAGLAAWGNPPSAGLVRALEKVADDGLVSEGYLAHEQATFDPTPPDARWLHFAVLCDELAAEAWERRRASDLGGEMARALHDGLRACAEPLRAMADKCGLSEAARDGSVVSAAFAITESVLVLRGHIGRITAARSLLANCAESLDQAARS